MIYSGSDINRRFYYDSNNQLIRENHRPITTTKTWEYDDLGNILVAKRYAYSSVVTLQNPKEVVTYNYGTDADAGWNNLLTSIVTEQYTSGEVTSTVTETIDYDAIGNQDCQRKQDHLPVHQWTTLL